MSKERVQSAIRELEQAINDGEHNCDVEVEHLGDAKEVNFYLDADQDAPVGSITVTPGE